MEAIGRYLLQLVATAILCAILGSLCEKSTFFPVFRTIAGIVMLLTALRPIANLQLSDFTVDFTSISAQGESIIASGEDTAQAAISEIISKNVSAYIEDKATCWGADIEVQTAVENGVPDSIAITGTVSPYVRSQLTSWIESEIGIKREALDWS